MRTVSEAEAVRGAITATLAGVAMGLSIGAWWTWPLLIPAIVLISAAIWVWVTR